MLLWLITCILVAIAMATAVFVAIRWMWRKGKATRLVAISSALLLIAGLAWSIYDAIHPPSSYYMKELAHVSDIRLPASIDVLDKTATFPDFHGHYYACLVVELDAAGLDAINKKIASRQPKAKAVNFSCSDRKSLLLTASTFNIERADYRRMMPTVDLSDTAGVDIALSKDNRLAKIQWFP